MNDPKKNTAIRHKAGRVPLTRLLELIRDQSAYIEHGELIPHRSALDIKTALQEYRQTLETLN